MLREVMICPVTDQPCRINGCDPKCYKKEFHQNQSTEEQTDPDEDKENDSDYFNERENNFKRAWK